MLRLLCSHTPTQDIKNKNRYISYTNPDQYALDTITGQDSDDNNSDEKHKHVNHMVRIYSD